MGTKRISIPLLIILLCYSLFQLYVPSFHPLTPVACALPDMAPSDGDAWTENNNATYTWTTEGAIEFTTENPHIGFYSLKVNHTSATTSLNFRIDLRSEQDFSSYDAISLWLYLQGKRSKGLTLSASDIRGNRYRFAISAFDNATWIRLVIPLNAFLPQYSPSWTRVQYIEFYDIDRTPSDYTTYYIDGLRFTDFETPIVSGIESEVLLPNFFFSISKYGDKRVIYNKAAYSSLYAFVNVSTGVPDSYRQEDLESQSLGQTLFALAIAYNLTKSTYLKTKIEAYTLWIDQLRSTTQYKGIRNYFFNNTITFSTLAGTTQNGWILVGLSYMYNITGDATYQNIADDIRKMLVDQVWDDTNRWFDHGINTQTGAVTDTVSWVNDVQGSAVLGLSAYYRFVSANETVKNRVTKCLNKQLTKSPNEAFTTGRFERDSYMHWGYYEAYKAFKNSTYWKYALAQAQINLAYNMIYLNGSMGFKNNFVPMNQDVLYGFLDEWGATNSLLLLLLLYQETGDNRILQSFRKTMFDHIVQVKTPLWLVSRYQNAKGSYEMRFNTKSWQPTQAFIYASLVKYYYDIYKPLRPYPILSTHEVKTVQFVPMWSSISEISGDGANATVNIYIPYDNETEKPFPNDYWQNYINETMNWESKWDSANRILSVWAVCNTTFRIVIERENTPPIIWEIKISPENPTYQEKVIVRANITDERSGVREAILSYQKNSTWVNITMTQESFFYEGTIPFFPYGTIVAYKAYASDNAANWNESEVFTYSVRDGTPPRIFFPPLIVKKLSSYDEVNIRITVNEPATASGVANVTLWFRVDDGEWRSQRLSLRGGTGTFLLQVQKGVNIVQYYAEAYDKAGNKATSKTYSYIPKEEFLILGLPIAWFGAIVIATVGLISVSMYFVKVRKSRRHQSQVKKV